MLQLDIVDFPKAQYFGTGHDCSCRILQQTFNEIGLQNREVHVHAMKAYGRRRSIVPLIRNVLHKSLSERTGVDRKSWLRCCSCCSPTFTVLYGVRSLANSIRIELNHIFR